MVEVLAPLARSIDETLVDGGGDGPRPLGLM